MATAATTADPAYAVLQRYEGIWQVTRSGQPANAKPELLVNNCSLLGKYYACQQSVNENVTGLIVMISTGKPGQFRTQTVLPEGRATGVDMLEIDGDRWTFRSDRRASAKTQHYRNIYMFKGKDQIHFEQAESVDGEHWTVKNAGDERRVRSMPPKRGVK